MALLVMPELKTVGALVAWARQSLAQAGVSNGAQEAMWLLEYVLEVQSHQLVSQADRLVSPDVWARAESLIARRMACEPLQYILGTQEFCGLEFAVSSSVLIPRPETELLVREVVRQHRADQKAILVDVGTGSGCLAVTLTTILRGSRVLAIDRSADALQVAKRNAATHGVLDAIEWLHGDLLAPLAGRGLEGRVDVIVSNPPYIAERDMPGLQPEVRLFEPHLALVSGPLGTEFHRRLLQDAHAFLSPRGMLAMEIGQGQAGAVRALAQDIGGYAPVVLVEDAAGIERVVIAQKLG
jgi:release factor glutamine methyltransferase